MSSVHSAFVKVSWSLRSDVKQDKGQRQVGGGVFWRQPSRQLLGVGPLHLRTTGTAAPGFVSSDTKAFVKSVIALTLLLYGNCQSKDSMFPYVLGVTGFPNSERMSYLW